jgi:predicted transposase/invertase (TIGR01784 family)
MCDHQRAMRPVFADPKTDFVFKKLFGSEEHKPLLIALLHTLLELDDAHMLEEVSFLPAEQKPLVEELKWSIVDVKCRDIQGTTYVVEMQVLNVEAFEKRVVYNACKAYTQQLRSGEGYPHLDDVIAVSICGFSLWPTLPDAKVAVPMLSRWQMQEQHSGIRGLPHIQHVFLELTKYTCGDKPVTLLEKWAYFFTSASDFRLVPDVLVGTPIEQALTVSKTAAFTVEEWDAYDRAKIAEQDKRGLTSLARKEGKIEGFRDGRAEGLREGEAKGLREAILSVCDILGIECSQELHSHLASLNADKLALFLTAVREKRALPSLPVPEGSSP